HGKTSQMTHTNQGIFKNIPTPFTATRYHSLIIERASLPSCLTVTAETADGTIMGVEHTSQPVFGVQFHPESIASEHGHAMLKNFLEIL
ncbi:MAG: gamma-glutamyl-gamma-aminobutyrate hydrolase family protein, partial [Rickettsiales bacterium]|nr:gamma-glutamyl-gamma-aminobutyrate hydrolase family protein [Rickettsiales bacterium]